MRTIRQLRDDRKWPRRTLSRLLDVAESTIYNWERGKNEPSATQLKALAEAFEVSMDDIDLTPFLEGKAIAA